MPDDFRLKDSSFSPMIRSPGERQQLRWRIGGGLAPGTTQHFMAARQSISWSKLRRYRIGCERAWII